MEAANTFKPTLYTKEIRDDAYLMNTGKGNQGYAQYLSRAYKAKQMKEEVRLKETIVFKTGSNWRPEITNPIAPK